MQEDSKELHGLQAKLDKLVHHKEKSAIQGTHLHAFIYFVTIHNLTESTVTLLGRKWILVNEDGTTPWWKEIKLSGNAPYSNQVAHFLTTATMSPTYLPKPVGLSMESTSTAIKCMYVWIPFVWKSRSILLHRPPTREDYRPQSSRRDRSELHLR